MDRREIARLLAPCGLSCAKCLAFEDSPIRRHAEVLARELGPNFAAYATRLAAMNPVLSNYESFRVLLDFLAQGSCRGCREGGCLFGDCPVRTCIMGKGHLFCADCPDFPCPIQGLPVELERVWRAANQKIRELGVEAYFERIKDKPRYP